ncbi:MAG: sigma 54-interacting transcriptional regulator [Desulfobacterales bacterium]|uniref:Sigma 54-interacting transcriptional regulator n=1 Tax=Candidatus Desulfatibia vada TaxID=2841696 RepID=A0A8J6TLB1_9BACT|nr:sigma 54-interacting transcriptional regulator [Candidatus Desulfatibia vada]MBL6970596.1 sigma 54-interacting transcriptional regulator [Desulfobacterales bacterium]
MKEHEINLYWTRIIDTMNDGLILIGTDGTIVMVNQAFELLTGYSSDEVIGRPCTFLKCDACTIELKRKDGGWCTLFDNEDGIKRRCLIMKKDGTYLPIIKNASILKNDQGVLLGAVETFMDISELDRLDHEIEVLSRQIDHEDGFHGIIGKAPIIQKVFDVVHKAAQSDAPVLVHGESGTGKELVARAIHLLGRRKDGPFVQLNCAALNEALLESELFGHIKGAFTGAIRHRLGRFEAAHGGDIFLDEIGDVPLPVQVKLLRVLETKRFERVGEHQSISVDVRIITATNQNLEELIARKEFREDLFFRINVIPIYIPPLRSRKEDIPLLVNAFIRRLQTRTGKKITGLTPEAMEQFMAYQWPGNIRELKSALEYAFVIAEQGLIGPDHLPLQIAENKGAKEVNSQLFNHKDMVEKNELIKALRQSRGNQSQASRILGINRVTVWNRMKKYGIDLKKVIH